MARIGGELVINRPVEEVFDFVADERNEPRYNRVSGGPRSFRLDRSAGGHGSGPRPARSGGRWG
jgi:hypothetical protein